MSWQIVECLLRKIAFSLKVFYSYISLADMGANGTLSSVRTLLVQTNRQTDGHIYCSDTFLQTNRQTDGLISCSDIFLQTNRQTDGQTVLRNYYIDWKVHKVERALASSIFELNPPKFQNHFNFGKSYNLQAGPIKRAGRNF